MSNARMISSKLHLHLEAARLQQVIDCDERDSFLSYELIVLGEIPLSELGYVDPVDKTKLLLAVIETIQKQIDQQIALEVPYDDFDEWV